MYVVLLCGENDSGARCQSKRPSSTQKNPSNIFGGESQVRTPRYRDHNMGKEENGHSTRLSFFPPPGIQPTHALGLSFLSFSLSLENGLMQMSGGARPRGRAEKEEEAGTRRFPARGLLNSQISKAVPPRSKAHTGKIGATYSSPPPSGTFSGGERGMGVG